MAKGLCTKYCFYFEGHTGISCFSKKHKKTTGQAFWPKKIDKNKKGHVKSHMHHITIRLLYLKDICQNINMLNAMNIA